MIKRRKATDIEYFDRRKDYEEIVTLTEYNPLQMKQMKNENKQLRMKQIQENEE